MTDEELKAIDARCRPWFSYGPIGGAETVMRTDLPALLAHVRELRTVLRRLTRGDCWCDVGIGSPMAGNYHSAVCDRARALLGVK